MGRALVREPAVFLLDEPLSNLDAKLRGQVRAEIAELRRRTGITMLYVTHDQVEAMTLGDRVAVIDRGRAPAGRPAARALREPRQRLRRGLHRQPADEPRARPRHVRPRRPRRSRRRRAPAALRRPLAGAAGRTLTLGLRPEHLALGADDGAPAAMRVEVLLIEALGADTMVHGRIAGDAALLTVRLAGTAPVAVGARLCVLPDTLRLHLFDPADGRRLTI